MLHYDLCYFNIHALLLFTFFKMYVLRVRKYSLEFQTPTTFAGEPSSGDYIDSGFVGDA
jgi:hypothetical protein